VNCYEAIDLMGDAIEGTLAPEARAGLDDHFAECPPCRNYMDQLRVTCQALGRLGGPGEPGDLRSELIAKFRQELQDGK
jgi:predicted anti-sigma-YlaC factor YlaD